MPGVRPDQQTPSDTQKRELFAKLSQHLKLLADHVAVTMKLRKREMSHRLRPLRALRHSRTQRHAARKVAAPSSTQAANRQPCGIASESENEPIQQTERRAAPLGIRAMISKFFSVIPEGPSGVTRPGLLVDTERTDRK
jgi:hypothetical protein